MSGRESRPPDELNLPQLRHGGRGEPVPTQRELQDRLDEADRERRAHEAATHGEHVAWWKRLFAGRLFRR